MRQQLRTLTSTYEGALCRPTQSALELGRVELHHITSHPIGSIAAQYVRLSFSTVCTR